VPAALATSLQMPVAYLCGVSTTLLASLERDGDRDRLPQDTVLVRLDDNVAGLEVTHRVADTQRSIEAGVESRTLGG
jgi:hypothetical protein